MSQPASPPHSVSMTMIPVTCCGSCPGPADFQRKVTALQVCLETGELVGCRHVGAAAGRGLGYLPDVELLERNGRLSALPGFEVLAAGESGGSELEVS
jgi:hypothetical protein